MQRIASGCREKISAVGARMKTQLRTEKAYEKFPRYSALLGFTIWLHGQVPAPEKYFATLNGSSSLVLLSGALFVAAPVFAILLGVIGLWRAGRWNVLLSATGILFSYKMMSEHSPFSVSLWLESAAAQVWWFTWAMPSAFVHELFAGNVSLMIVYWTAYLFVLYCLLRPLAVMLLRLTRPRAMRLWSRFSGRTVRAQP